MGQLGLVLAYVLPLALVVWIWVRGEKASRLRIPVLIFLPVFYVGHWHFLGEFQGWPVSESLPESFELVSASIIEPDVSTDTKGSVYLWVRENLHGIPRAYGLPYSRQLHELVVASKRKLSQGIRQQGTVKGRENSGKGASLNNNMYLVLEDATQRILPAKSL